MPGKKKATTGSVRGQGARGPTLRDVANRAGVSQATVSVILNDGPMTSSFSPETRERVRVTAADLGYTINPLARALRRKRSGVLGCILFNHQDIYYTRIAEIAEAYAREHGYEFVLTSMGYDIKRFEPCLSQLRAWHVEGLLVMFGGRPLPAAQLAQVKALKIPYIVGDSEAAGEVDSAALFGYRSGRLLAEHLYELGHRDFAAAGVNPANLHSSERLRGAEEWLAEAGIRLRETRKAAVSEGLFGANAGYQCTHALLDRAPGFTALVCTNDLVALGALAALRARGLRVPEDCSVAGFNDIPLDYAGAEENRLCRFTAPPLTTVRFPMREFSREAMRRLIAHVEKKEGESSYSVEMHPRLIVRGSTAPPKRAT